MTLGDRAWHRRDFLRMTGAGALALAGIPRWPAGGSFDLSRWLQPVRSESIFADPDWCIWCGSMAAGDDGRFHLFYSRWPSRLGHLAWVTHSEVAHAIADRPTGPYRHAGVALPARGAGFWDGSCTHNPSVIKNGGRYYLYYMGNVGDGIVQTPLNWVHRNRQRIGVAVADSPSGPWQRFARPLIDVSPDPAAPDALVVTNPAVCARPQGGYLMVYKAVAKLAPPPFGGPVVHLAATSDSPTGPFHKELQPIFTRPGDAFPAEDPFIWHDGERYRAIVKDNHGAFTGRGYSLASFESRDGSHWSLARHPLVATPDLAWSDGQKHPLTALERPQLWRDAAGLPAVLFCAAAATADRSHSFNLAIPLRRPT